MKFKYKNAWTFAEMLVALVIVISLSALVLHSVKNSDKKQAMYLYSTLRNLNAATGLVLDKLEEKKTIATDDTVEIGGDENSKYCIIMADSMNLANNADCKKTETTNDTTVNYKFPNGVEIQGLGTPWTHVCKESSPCATDSDDYRYSMRHIVIDLDGVTKGYGVIGADRFPVTIYANSANQVSIYPSDCTATTNKNPYCGSTAVNFAKQNDILTYDVYMPDSSSKESVKMYQYITNLSVMEADCKAYGGLGLWNAEECKAAGTNFRPAPYCLATRICTQCAKESNCYDNQTTPQLLGSRKACIEYSQTVNPYGKACVALAHKPHQGTTFMMDYLTSGLGDY